MQFLRDAFRRVSISFVWAVFALVLSFASAQADLVGRPATPPPLTPAEQAVVLANPVLARLADSNPWVVRAALDDLAAAQRSGAGERDVRGELNMLGASDAELVSSNPALRKILQASPEAAVDLLALIRAAAGKGSGPSSKAVH